MILEVSSSVLWVHKSLEQYKYNLLLLKAMRQFVPESQWQIYYEARVLCLSCDSHQQLYTLTQYFVTHQQLYTLTQYFKCFIELYT